MNTETISQSTTTDLEKVKSLFDELGIGHEDATDGDEITLTLTAKFNEKVVGYSDFEAIFQFELNGKFKQVGIWE